MSSSCDPMDCSLPVSSIHGIFQARVLEWVAISSFTHFLISWLGIFPTQDSNPGLLHCRQILYQPSYERRLKYILGIIIIALHPLLLIAHSNKPCENIIYAPPGNLPDPGVKPRSPALAVGFFITSATWEAHVSKYTPKGLLIRQ